MNSNSRRTRSRGPRRVFAASLAALLCLSTLAACSGKDSSDSGEIVGGSASAAELKTLAPRPGEKDPAEAADAKSLITRVDTPAGFTDSWRNVPVPSRADIPLENSRAAAMNVAQKCVELYYWTRYNRNGSQIEKWTRAGSPYEKLLNKVYRQAAERRYVLEGNKIEYRGTKVIYSNNEQYAVLVNVQEGKARLFIGLTGEVTDLPPLATTWRVQVSYSPLGWECRSMTEDK